MKMILTGLLLLSAVPIFAQDSLSYEEFPECFFEVAASYQKSHTEEEFSKERIIGIDTCNSSEILYRPSWPTPVNENKNMLLYSQYKYDLRKQNKIYSNYLFSGFYENHFESLFDEVDEYHDIKEGSIEQFRDDFPEIKEFFKNLKDSIGDFKIYFQNYKYNDNGKYDILGFSLVFDKIVSLGFLQNNLAELKVYFADTYFTADLESIEEQKSFLVEQNSNIIKLTNIQNILDIKIYDIRGALLDSFNDIHATTYVIDMNSYGAGVFFIQINNLIISYNGVI